MRALTSSRTRCSKTNPAEVNFFVGQGRFLFTSHDFDKITWPRKNDIGFESVKKGENIYHFIFLLICASVQTYKNLHTLAHWLRFQRSNLRQVTNVFQSLISGYSYELCEDYEGSENIWNEEYHEIVFCLGKQQWNASSFISNNV